MQFMFGMLFVFGSAFLISGMIYFISATRYVQFQKARHIRFDEEAAEWKKREEEKAQTLISAMGLSTGEPPEPITGLFNSPGFYEDFDVDPNMVSVPRSGSGMPRHVDDFKVELKEESGDPDQGFEKSMPNMDEVVDQVRDGIANQSEEFEESGGRRDKEKGDWINYVRAYWSQKVKTPTTLEPEGILVYPTKSEATDAALRTAHRLGMTELFPKIIDDYALDIDVYRVIVEWTTDNDESHDVSGTHFDGETYKNATEKND